VERKIAVQRTKLLDKKHHKSLKRMEVQSADGKRCGFDDVQLVRVHVRRGGGSRPVRNWDTQFPRRVPGQHGTSRQWRG